MSAPTRAPRPKTFPAYGLEWPLGTSAIAIHVYLIRKGGLYKDEASGRMVGASLFALYRELQSLLWPEDDHHEWSDLMLKTMVDERITVVQGGKDSSKTHTMAKFALTDYLCFPEQTLSLMSSTDLRGLELRVWGDLKDLFTRARDRWPEIPGHPVDHLHGIFTDALSDDSDIRDIRKGLLCIPMLESGGSWKGLEKYTGIKQKRRRLFGDEVQFMLPPYLTALANLNKGDFKGVFVGNPIGEGDPLDKLAEPLEGWDSLPEVTKTSTWKNRMGGTTINLVGSDSPAIHHPGKYPYLIDQSDIDYIVGYWGRDSAEYWNQAEGVRRPGVSLRRVVTRDMISKFGAQDEVVWSVKPTIKGYAIDASYGGDRCIGGSFEFGFDINGHQVISFGKPKVIPIKLYPKTVPEELRILPEDQIAEYARADCESLGIPSAHLSHDATGRGSLGSAFARLWRHDTNPIEFGGSATPRPVLADLFIYDEKLKAKRLKRCDEHYSKFVSELWFSVRYVIEGRQSRNLPSEAVDELCAREWKRVRGDRIEVESKEDMKPRFGRSPDIGDWVAICVEGARRLGFQITRMGWELKTEKKDERWKEELRERARKAKQSYSLTYR